jgi:hypothetical protein
MAIDFGPQRLDSSRNYELTLVKGDGTAADLSSVTAYTAVLAPGSGLPAVATLAASTLSAPAGTVTVTIDNGAILGLIAGTYQVFVTATAGGEPIDASGEATVELTDGPGTAPAPTPLLTRAKFERELNDRCGPMLGAADRFTGAVGGNRAWGVGIREACRWVRLPLADPSEVTDADLAVADSDRIGEMFDVAEFRMLTLAARNFNQVGWASGSQRQDLHLFKQQLLADIEAMRADLVRRWGYGANTLTPGSIGLGSDATTCDAGRDWGGW